MPKAIVALSGGLDSATLLASMLHNGCEVVTALSFAYGSKHNKWELPAAAEVARHYHVPHGIIDLSSISKWLESNLLGTGGEIPEGHYEAETMKATVVPGRNLIFASILTGIADSYGCQIVGLGVHAGDHAIYPDCRPEFVLNLNITMLLATESRVEVAAPFLYLNKAQVLATGLELGVPYDLTRTCYKAQEIACGKCGACQERLEAFRIVGADDPIAYEYRGDLSA